MQSNPKRLANEASSATYPVGQLRKTPVIVDAEGRLEPLASAISLKTFSKKLGGASGHARLTVTVVKDIVNI